MGTASAGHQSMSSQGLLALQGITPRTSSAQACHQSPQILPGCTLVLVTIFSNFHHWVGHATTVWCMSLSHRFFVTVANLAWGAGWVPVYTYHCISGDTFEEVTPLTM
jgi:hypothetical protein